MQQYLTAAAKDGTGTKAAPDNCVSGIKTGTAQTGVYEDGHELLNFWYCGFVGDSSGPRYSHNYVIQASTKGKPPKTAFSGGFTLP